MTRNALRAFLALWMVTGVILLVGSVDTARAAWFGARHANPHIMLLGTIEAVSAALFLLPRTMRIGGIGLLATISIAFIVHTALGQFRGDLLVYAVAVLFVATHGTVSSSQVRDATLR